MNDAKLNLTVRSAAAVLVLAGGLLHLKLYYDGYRDWPNDNLGRMFLLNAIGSIAIAVALAAWKHWAPVLAGLGMVNGTLFAFGVSRTDAGVPFTHAAGPGARFSEVGWSPSPEAALSLIAEVGAAAALIALLPGVLVRSPLARWLQP